MYLRRIITFCMDLGVAAAIVCVAGCTGQVVRSDHVETCAATTTAAKGSCQHHVPVGLVYSLPKGQILLSAFRKLISQDDVAKATSNVASAQQAVLDAAKAVAAAKATQQKNSVPGESDLQKVQDQAAVDAAAATLDAGQAAAAGAKQVLQDLRNGIGKKYVETFTLTPLAVIPDNKRRFVANLAHSPWRDDTLKLSVANGLLTTSSAQSTDQTGAIVSNLLSAAVGVVTFAGAGIPLVPGPAALEAAAVPKRPEECEYVYARSFDPTDRDDIEKVTDALKKLAANFDLASTFKDDVAEGHEPDTLLGYSATDSESIDGLVYRAPVGVGVGLVPKPNATKSGCPLQSWPQAQTLQIFVPDTNADFIVPASAGALTTSTSQLTFTNGMLTDFNQTRPSEIAAGAGIPVDIVNKIMTIPTSIVKLRVDYTTQQASLANQKAALITAQNGEALALVTARTALESAQTNLSTAQINDPTARYQALTALVQARQAVADAISAAKKSNEATTP